MINWRGRVQSSGSEHGRDRHHRRARRSDDDATDTLDLRGATLATTGLGLTTWALTEGSRRGWSLFALVILSAAGYTATQAGAALLPLPLVIAVASPVAGALSAKIGPGWPLVVGPVIVALGFLLALRIGPDTSYWLGVLPAMIVIALGLAGAVAPLTTAVLMSVDSHHTGAASGLNSAVARTGGLVATALIGAVLTSYQLFCRRSALLLWSEQDSVSLHRSALCL